MNQQTQQPRSQKPHKLSKSSSSPDFSKFVLPVLAVLALLGAANLSRSKPTYQTNLKDLELRNPSGIENQATAEAPRYGLRDLEAHEQQVNLILWDNGAEDGDFVGTSHFCNEYKYSNAKSSFFKY